MAAAGWSVFVGRRRELGELDGALRALGTGRGQFCTITGAAGMGKTRLAEELAERATASGARVLWGGCPETGAVPGYWPWVQTVRRLIDPPPRVTPRRALGDALAVLARTLPLFTDAPAAGALGPASDRDRFALFDAVASVLRWSARQTPLVIVLDDLHATDVPSLRLLDFVLCELRAAPLLVIGTYREVDADADGERGALLARIARRAQRLALAAWTEEEVGQFVERALGRPAPVRLVQAVHHLTEGNPFYTVEVLRHLDAAHPGELPADLPAGAPLPSGVRHSIRGSIARLSATDRAIVAVAAVVGREFDLDILTAATGRVRDVVLGALGRAAAAGLVAATCGGPRHAWAFRHGVIGTTLYEDVPETERAVLHRRVAEALMHMHRGDAEAHVAAIAYHLLRGSAAGGAELALEYALRAARAATARTAYEDAAARYADAIALLTRLRPDDAGRRAELLLALGEVQTRIATAAGRTAFQRAAAAARAAGDPALLARAALGFAERGLGVPHHLPDRAAVALLDEALAALPAGDSPLRARLLARSAVELAVSEDRARGDALSTTAVAMARRLADRAALAFTLSVRSFVLWRWNDAADRLAIAAEGVRLAEALGDADLELQGRVWVALDLMRAGDAHRLDAQISRFVPLAEQFHHPRYLWLAANFCAMRAIWRGDLAAAEAHIQRALAAAERVDDRNARLTPLVQLFAVRREQGRMAEQLPMARAAVARAPDSPVPRTLLAVALCELGQHEEARCLLDGLAREGFADLHRDQRLGVLPYLAEVCAAVGDAPRAAMLTALLRPLADVNVPYGASVCLGVGAHWLGVLASTQGAHDDAVAHFETALARHARMDAPLLLARTQVAAAHALRARGRAGDRQRAERLLAQARASARAHGFPSVLDAAARSAAEDDAGEEPVRHAVGQSGGASSVPAAGTALRARRVVALPDRGRRRGPAVPIPTAVARHSGVFRREGELWAVGDGGTLVRLKDSKGLRYLAHLLRHPGREMHVLDLAALEHGAETVAAPSPGLRIGRGDAALPALDPTAKAAYKRRLEDLRDTLDEAMRFNDPDRAARARAEIDALGRELARGLGLGGRERATGSPRERARLNVSRAIAHAIKRITAQHPAIGRLLTTTIKTGAFCSYTPDPRFDVDWQL
jgi:hypothetical protein